MAESLSRFCAVALLLLLAVLPSCSARTTTGLAYTNVDSASRRSLLHSATAEVSLPRRAHPLRAQCSDAIKAWNVSLSRHTWRTLYSPSDCQMIAYSPPCPQPRTSEADSCDASLLLVDYTSGEVLDTLWYQLQPSQNETLARPLVLALSPNQQTVITATTSNWTNNSPGTTNYFTCVHVSGATQRSGRLAKKWMSQLCRDDTSTPAEPAVSVQLVADKAIVFERSNVLVERKSVNYTWQVLDTDTGFQLSSMQTPWQLLGTLDFDTVQVHQYRDQQLVSASVTSADGGDYYFGQLLLYRLSSSGELVFARNCSADWNSWEWTTLSSTNGLWVQYQNNNQSHWRGLDMLTGKLVWTVTNDVLLAGHWPYMNMWPALPAAPVPQVYVECTFNLAHPYNTSLFLVSQMILSRQEGGDDVFWGVMGVYSTETGERIVMSAPLGPAAYYSNTVDCNEPPQAFVDGSALLIIVEQRWYALHPYTAERLSEGLLAHLSLDWPSIDAEWTMLSLSSDGGVSALIETYSAGWTAATHLPYNASDDTSYPALQHLADN